MILIIMVGDLLAPADTHLGPLLIVAPAITASFAGPRLTAALGGAAMVCHVLLSVHDRALGTERVQTEIIAVVAVSILVVVYCLARDRQRKQLVQIRSVSEVAQSVLMRPIPQRSGPLSMASLYLAAQAEAKIGGDLYGAARTAAGTRLIIGDVRGKGLGAISDAALLLGAFRETARRQPELPALVSDLEESLRSEMEEFPDADLEAGEAFVTAVVLDIPDDVPVLSLINCGHPPPLLIRAGDVIELCAAQPAPPLGLGELTRPHYTVQTFAFEQEDVLLLYTDGVVEARDGDGTFYPLTERLAQWAQDGPQGLLGHVHDDLLRHIGSFPDDDAALVAVQRGDGGTARSYLSATTARGALH
ncbi:PP2C family protein-serine/threonine phosphatase [Microtetraspora sp. NBRC 13810]|uniref:PP2C family protein-serine/threonine phosphatase n=1 Tax=Microtetraspora sp. NBRC 13810 TaxID=3030990 RepID=UPI002552F17E|nr:PP2C family protein-serine/threonine phosphatase [Microtetraspora sp. NBRC 13810]